MPAISIVADWSTLSNRRDFPCRRKYESGSHIYPHVNQMVQVDKYLTLKLDLNKVYSTGQRVQDWSYLQFRESLELWTRRENDTQL